MHLWQLKSILHRRCFQLNQLVSTKVSQSKCNQFIILHYKKQDPMTQIRD